MEGHTLQVKTKDIILNEALKIIPFMGWNKNMLEEASIKSGLDRKAASLIFLEGVDGLLDYYLQDLDKKMLYISQTKDIKKLKIQERVFEAIKIRIEIIAKNKIVTIKTMTYLLLPWNISQSSKFIWRTIDLIWKDICDDCSTDFNYYTKRSLLYGVYVSTVMYWLSDTSLNYNDTYDFLKRKLSNVLKIGGFINKIKRL